MSLDNIGTFVLQNQKDSIHSHHVSSFFSSQRSSTNQKQIVFPSFVFKEEKVAKVNGSRMTPSQTTRHDTTRTNEQYWSTDRHATPIQRTNVCSFTFHTSSTIEIVPSTKLLSDQRSNFIEIFFFFFVVVVD